eukprot:1227691-Prymnesium_polylepis.1
MVGSSWPYFSNAGGRGGSEPKTRVIFSRIFRRCCATQLRQPTAIESARTYDMIIVWMVSMVLSRMRPQGYIIITQI